MDELRTGLSYGDVLLVPQRSPVDSRSDVDLSTPVTPDVELATPLCSAPMDTVTESETAIALGRAGGFGTIHRFLDPEEQAAEVREVAEAGQPVGADTVMMGSLFAGTEEAPGELVETDGERYKRSRGMATTAAAEDRSDKEGGEDLVAADEGVEGFTAYKGPLEDVAGEFAAGIRSGLSYCGGHTIPTARERAEFIRVEQAAKEREGAHGDHDWETVSVDD